MRERRRIFKAAPRHRRRWPGILIGLLVAGAGAALIGVGLPSDLMGQAPLEAEWHASASQVQVIDGDTLRLDDRVVRLAGLRAPQRGQACASNTGSPFDCGAAATEALARLVAAKPVVCHVSGHDTAGRALGLCIAGNVVVNLSLVRDGWAEAEPHPPAALALPPLGPLAAAAQAAGRGMWQHRAASGAGSQGGSPHSAGSRQIVD